MADPILYDAGDVLDKVLVAAKTLPIYDSYPPYTYKQIGIVNKGDTAGVVYSWISQDFTQNRPTLWWMFEGSDGHFYYMPHHSGDFNIDVLQAQGVQTTAEKNAPEQEWYQKILNQILPVVVIAVIGAAAVKGYFSSRKQ